MAAPAGSWWKAALLAWAGWTTGPALAEWQLQHEESFARSGHIDPAVWRLETGFLRNREEQYYTDANARIEDGVLRIEARREDVPNAQWRAGARDWRVARRTAQYTSASLVSRQPLHYGRVEVVARTPSGAGVWPAIWLLHEGQDLYGEIDLFEAVGKHPDTVFAGVHHGRDPRSRKHRNESRVVPGFEGRWHTHTLEWTPAAIRIALDGKTWFTFDPGQARLRSGANPLLQPMRLHINLALGGSWGGVVDDSRLPARFDIASIRIWRWLPGAADTPPLPLAAVAPAPEARAPAEAPLDAPMPAAATAGVPAPVPASAAAAVALPASEPPARPLRWGR